MPEFPELPSQRIRFHFTVLPASGIWTVIAWEAWAAASQAPRQRRRLASDLKQGDMDVVAFGRGRSCPWENYRLLHGENGHFL